MASSGGLIGALRVDLKLDSANFEAGTKRARGIAQRDAAAIQKSLASIKGSLNGLLAAGVVTALVGAGKRALAYASSLQEVAQQAGVSAKELQEYRYAASQSGISNEEMEKSLAKLSRTMGEAKAGSKAQVSVFRELGVAIQDANGRVYSAGEVFPKLAEALSKIKDPATRARLEVDLFGKAGQKLDTLLSQGASGVNQLRDAAQKLGLVLSDKQIQDADETADKLDAIKQVLEARIAGVVSDNANSILALANSFAALASAAASANKTVPGLLTTLAGATIGGKIGGAPGAMIGAITGLSVELYDRAYGGDPHRVRNETKENLIARQRASVKARRELNRGGYSESEEFKALAAEGHAIDVEIQRRMAALKAGKPAVEKVVADGPLPVATPGKPKRGPKDKTAEYRERFEKERADLEDDALGLQIRLTNNFQARFELEAKRLRTAQDVYEHEIDTKQKAGELTKAEADELRLKSRANLAQEQTVLSFESEAEIANDNLRLAEAMADLKEEGLRNELSEARTAAERRAIGLRLLDAEIERERAALEHVRLMWSLNKATDGEVAAAEARLAALEGSKAQRAGAIRRDTMGPMEAYLDSLPRTADELREKFESIKVDTLNRGLEIASQNVLKLKGVAGDLFNQLISDVIKLQMQQALTGGGGGVLGSIGKFLGLATTVAGGGGGMQGAVSSANGLPKLARGGIIGGLPGIDRNVLAINGIPRAMVSANENIHVTPANDRGAQQPIQIYFTGEESAMLVPRVTGIAGGAAVQTFAEGSRASYKRARQRL